MSKIFVQIKLVGSTSVIQISISRWLLSSEEIDRALSDAHVHNKAQQNVLDSVKHDAEWSDTRTNFQVRGMTYTHHQFTDGYYQQGFPIGGDGQMYSIGGDI